MKYRYGKVIHKNGFVEYIGEDGVVCRRLFPPSGASRYAGTCISRYAEEHGYSDYVHDPSLDVDRRRKR